MVVWQTLSVWGQDRSVFHTRRPCPRKAESVLTISRSWLRASVCAAASAIEFSSWTSETISGRGGLHVVNMIREEWVPHSVVGLEQERKLSDDGDDAPLIMGVIHPARQVSFGVSLLAELETALCA